MTTVLLPRLLDPASGGRRRWEIPGETVGEVVAGLLAQAPELRVHLFDHRGALRTHVLCFVDGEPTRLDHPEAPAGSELRFLQAVSGG